MNTNIRTYREMKQYVEVLRISYDDVQFPQTRVGRRYYADLIARCLSAYDEVNDIASLTPGKLESGIHAYARVLCSMAVLLREGDTERYADLCPRLFADRSAFRALYVTVADRAYGAVSEGFGRMTGNFAVKELALAYEIVQNLFPDTVLARWRAALAPIRPTGEFYTHANKYKNLNTYVGAGQMLMGSLGITDRDEAVRFLDDSWEKQRERFNDLGMYLDEYEKDPHHNPVLYDLAARVNLQLALSAGYDGKYRGQMEQTLHRGALTTLFSMSADFSLPFGGRSNQYLFNEALICACCEYEAGRCSAAGDVFLAGIFRRAGHLSIRSVERWLNAGKHIRNFFSDPALGTEDYGNYGKYMVTFSSFLAIAWYFACDSVPETVCPAEKGGYVIEEYGSFNFINANSENYSVQISTDADPHYDALGLCRVVRRGTPPELALNAGFPAEPKYTVPAGTLVGGMSMSTAFRRPDGSLCPLACAGALRHTLNVTRCDDLNVSFTVEYTGGLLGNGKIRESYSMDEFGVHIRAELDGVERGDGKIYFTLPLLCDGGDLPGTPVPETSFQPRHIFTRAGDHRYEVSGLFSARPENGVRFNRNGRYNLWLLEAEGDTLSLTLQLS